jgi:hypothetical protein
MFVNYLILNACVKMTERLKCEKILTTSGYRNQIYFQTIHKIVNCTLCSWSRNSRTAFANISMSSIFPSFIVCWILNFVDQPTHENWYPTNKSDFTVVLFYFLHKRLPNSELPHWPVINRLYHFKQMNFFFGKHVLKYVMKSFKCCINIFLLKY